MIEWLLLVLLVPAIVAPVVLLFGFTGCGFQGQGQLPPLPVPVIKSATGKSRSIITLTWMIDPTATDIEFERRLVTPTGPVGPPFPFRNAASPAAHDDVGLAPGTTYEYTARAVYVGGDSSVPSPPVQGATLARATFDAESAGNTNSATDSATVTWSHTASSESTAVVVGLRWAQAVGLLPLNVTPARTAMFGGTPMTSLGVVGLNNVALTATALNATFVYLEFFRLLHPVTGTQPVTLSVSRPGAGNIAITGCSVSYRGVAEFGPVTSVFGTEVGAALMQTVSSATDEMVVQMFGTATGMVTGYTQTVRFDGSANGIGFVVGDAAGASSVAFTASRATSVDYAGLAVRLTPGP